MKLDVAALVFGLVCAAVAVVAGLQYLGRASITHLGALAPVTLIVVGVVGLLASRRNHNP